MAKKATQPPDTNSISEEQLEKFNSDFDKGSSYPFSNFSLRFFDAQHERVYKSKIWERRKLITHLGLLIILGTSITTYGVAKGLHSLSVASHILRVLEIVLVVGFLLVSFKFELSSKIVQYFLVALLFAVTIIRSVLWYEASWAATPPFLSFTILISFTFALSNLPFFTSLTVGIFMILSFNVTVIISYFEKSPTIQWPYWIIFVCSLSVLLAVCCYSNERSRRMEWFTSFQAFVREIQLIKLQQSEAITEAKSKFFANVSHEVRTPLHGLMGVVSFLKDTKLTSEQEEYIKVIESSVETLVSLTNDILDSAKIFQMGDEAMSIECKPYSIAKVIEEVFDIVGRQASEKGLEIGHYEEKDVPAKINGDASRVRQVLLKLVSNAIKFTEVGFVMLTAQVRDSSIKIKVQDTGRGIPEEAMHQLFLPLTQIGSNTVSEGTGLGLYLSKVIVEKMGGSIECKSTVGRGSEFCLSLPIHQTDSPSSLAGYGSPLRDSKSVLVVHSKGPVRESIEGYLRDRGHTVTSLEKISSPPPMVDAVLVQVTSNYERWIKVLEDSNPGCFVTLISRLGTSLPNREYPVLFAPVKLGPLVRIVEQTKRTTVAPTSSTWPHCNILLVEDNKLNQKVVLKILTPMNCKVDVAENGDQGVKMARDKKYDIILMDWQMPVMNGIEATQKIREFDSSVPILGLTAAGNQQQNCLDSGMNDCLLKPFTPGQLKGMVEQHLPSRNTTQ